MKKSILTAIAIASLLLSACSAKPAASTTTTAADAGKSDQAVEVKIQLPEKIALNQESTLKVQVKQGAAAVEDAEDIQFEIWSIKDIDDTETILAKHEGGGVYSVKKTFKKDGIYLVRTHVNARGQHVMPKERLIAGNVPEKDIQEYEATVAGK
ncbi:FixH family protein [Paenibacillus sp. FJAT-26967]|uniref:FixH family protein n=1 Tax=Paenibacillus sp. FJAT-26967 TaxID=1729690 RepID=UPI0008385A0A|nr:FixH family protein [Paenibacillus sp. FJAT-26967]